MPIHPSGVTRPAEGLSVPEVAAMPSKEQNTSGDDASSSEEKPGHSPGVTRPAEGLSVYTSQDQVTARPAEGLSVPEVTAMPGKEQITSGDDARSSEEMPVHSSGVTRPAEGLSVDTSQDQVTARPAEGLSVDTSHGRVTARPGHYHQ